MSFNSIYKTIERYNLLEQKDSLIIGVSGGADSVCLLAALANLRDTKEEFRDLKLFAVHVHHGIRGAEADRDASFVEKLAKDLSVPCRIVKINVPKLSEESGMSEEETGRRERYRIFEEIRDEFHFTKIAVAHNKNDLAETFLMNLARGTGLTGLAGIRPVNGHIIRPLIETDRSEIEATVRELGLDFVTDSTNLSDDYTRNRIRHVILPELTSAVNSEAVSHICEAAEKISAVDRFIKEEAKKALQEISTRGRGFFIVRNEAAELPYVILTEMIHMILADLAGRARDISDVHIRDVAGLFSKENGKSLDLIYGLTAVRQYEGVLIKNFSYEESGPEFKDIETEILTVPPVESVFAEAGNLRVNFSDGTYKIYKENSCNKIFDYDKITDSILVRTKEPGDFVVISTDGKRKKLSDILTDRKIPTELRERLPLLTAGHEVLWVPGVRSGESARVSKGTEKILCAFALKRY